MQNQLQSRHNQTVQRLQHQTQPLQREARMQKKAECQIRVEEERLRHIQLDQTSECQELENKHARNVTFPIMIM